MIFDIIALISTLSVIYLLRRLVNIFPSLVACIFRWKENIYLESSIKNSSDRNIIALAMIMPFCLIVDRFRLYDPQFLGITDEGIRLGITFGVLFLYYLLRTVISWIAYSGRISRRAYDAAGSSSFTFFIILVLILASLAGILSFLHIETEVIKNAMLWVSAFIYILYLLRKTQIFTSSCSIFTAFLYLCALEIIPTGLLIASALIF